MANCFLFYYEDEWIRKTKWKDLIQAKKFSNMFRFIVDPAAKNDDDEFEKIHHELPSRVRIKK